MNVPWFESGKKKNVIKIEGLGVKNGSKIFPLCLPKWSQMIFVSKKALTDHSYRKIKFSTRNNGNR